MSQDIALEEKLLRACSQSNLSLISECLKNGANMNMVCSSGRTPLGIAAEIGDLNTLNLLLGTINSCDLTDSKSSSNSNLGYFVVVHSDSNEDVTSKSQTMPMGIDFDDFNSSLVQSIPGLPVLASPDEEMYDLEWDVEFDHYDDCDIAVRDPWADMYIWYANILSQTGDLLPQQPPKDTVDGVDRFGCTALHYAAAFGHKDVINTLIKSGCKINVEDTDNFTPLHMAASKDDVTVVELLLCHGANPHHRSTDGVTPLHVCSSRGLLQNVQALVKAGASVNAVDISDRTPLYLAVSRRQHSVVAYLIAQGAKVNLEEIHGWTPLFEAVRAKDVPLVKLLLAAGAKVTQSHHLLHYAILHRQEPMVKVLLESGSIINLRNEEGDTPLMLAVMTQKLSIVKLLLESGALVHSVNHVTQQTALQKAIEGLNRDCSQFSRMFSLFEDFGWDWKVEKQALSSAITEDNDHAVVTIVRRSDILVHKDLPERTGMLNLLYLRDKQFLVELFVQAGFDLQYLHPRRSVREFTPWFLRHLQSPLSLQSLARIRVRSQLGTQIFRKLEQLYLPPIMKAFIRLEDVRCYCEGKEDVESEPETFLSPDLSISDDSM